MIKILENGFALSTNNTSYIFNIDKTKHLIHLYYGDKLEGIDEKTLNNLTYKMKSPMGNAIEYNDENPDLMLEITPVEISTRGKGDLRYPSIEIENANGSRTSDFTYDSYELKSSEEYSTLPSSKGDCPSLILHLKDINNKIDMDLIFTVFEEENVISRKTIIRNKNKSDIKLIKAFSINLDLKGDNYTMRSFHGHWGKEMGIYDQDIVIGRCVSETTAGVSSSRSNPFFILYKKGCTEDNGEAFGFNLVYSGNHQESVEKDTFNNIRVLTGINPETFNFILKENEEFEVPEAIMSYSSNGFTSLSLNFHHFIKEHIVDSKFKAYPRPVLNNSWEACYFNFDEKKLLKMGRCAKKLGVELFVLDDGWFGRRTDDTKGLGDWTENRKKLNHGLSGLSLRMQKIGLDFGIWVEPEMVNENSLLFETHPEWVIKIKGQPHSKGRHQMVLDLSNNEVINYLYKSMSYVFNAGKVKYVKWDMNRVFSDYYSETLDKDKMMELNHRYYLGLYSLLKKLKNDFPNILFESCASGGNRFDLGMLCYMPQTWASDDTDPFVRMKMQMAYSYGYPLQTLGCHVASSPTLTTLRRSDIDTRFNVAIYGAFGYEIDLREENKETKNRIIKQINIYKKYRDRIIDSDFYRLEESYNKYQCMCVSKDKSLAVLTYVKTINLPIDAYTNIKLKGLDKDAIYHVYSENVGHNIKSLGGAVNHISKIHIKDGGLLQHVVSKFIKLQEKGEDSYYKGDVLMMSGFNLKESFSGCGYNEDLMIMGDFSSRIFYFERVE